MRKFLVPMLFFVAVPTMAQEIHLSGGYNGSNVREAGSEHWVGRAGYQFGADILVGHRWFVKPGVHLLVRNLNYTYAGTADVPAQEFKYTSRSLAVPVMLGVYLVQPSEDSPISLYALGGPTAVMKLNADLDNSALNVETTGTQWYLGAGAGLGLGFLFVEGGYNVAMSNVFKGATFSTNPKANYLYASVGVRLRLAE